MNTAFDNLHQLHDMARYRADALRREAMDDFWRGANGLLAMGADSARRSAQRLAGRLTRRASDRNTSASILSHGA